MGQMFDPAHPGEILKEEFIEELDLTITETAKALGVSRQTLTLITTQKTGVTANMAIRLAKAFDTTPDFWVNLQRNYDLAEAKQNWEDLESAGEGIAIKPLFKSGKNPTISNVS